VVLKQAQYLDELATAVLPEPCIEQLPQLREALRNCQPASGAA
jgi:hypothetical protein